MQNVELPRRAYFGCSASIGDLHDAHRAPHQLAAFDVRYVDDGNCEAEVPHGELRLPADGSGGALSSPVSVVAAPTLPAAAADKHAGGTAVVHRDGHFRRDDPCFIVEDAESGRAAVVEQCQGGGLHGVRALRQAGARDKQTDN